MVPTNYQHVWPDVMVYEVWNEVSFDGDMVYDGGVDDKDSDGSGGVKKF